MAVQLDLVRTATGERVNLVKLDDELCAVLGVEPHPRNYVQNWMDTIGFALACGQSWDEVEETWNDVRPELATLIAYMRANFTNASYMCR